MTTIGILIGTGLAAVAATTVRSVLYDVSPFDPTLLGVAATLFIATNAAATWILAHRAASVDPIEALRTE